LLAWTIFTLIMWIGSFGTNPALTVVFTLLLATFAALTIGEFLGGPEKATGIIHIGGYLGIATAIAAWYTAAAEVLNDTYGRTILPLGGG
ncbi:MAG: acetate uptake transporter, partial [Actinobacteria bacterium]|nr:acetate uptake transporter [Actinomycetota bacterium]